MHGTGSGKQSRTKELHSGGGTRGSGAGLKSQESISAEHSPVSVREERKRIGRENSSRCRKEDYARSAIKTRTRTNEETEKLRFRRQDRQESRVHGMKPSSKDRYKRDSFGKRSLEGKKIAFCSDRGEMKNKDSIVRMKNGPEMPPKPGSNTSLQLDRCSARPSSGASSNTSTPTLQRSQTKVTKRKLDARIFSLSMELIEHVSKGRLELAEKKIKQGASPDYADYDKRTPLHLAASEGHMDVVKMLLKHGANPYVADRWGSKPYDEAVKHKFTEVADVLREYSEPDEEDTLSKDHHDGLELLEYCAKGYKRLVREKVAAGTKPTFADYDLRTPLHLASCEGHAKIADILLNNGADATVKDRFGNTPVDDAVRNGFLEVLAVMSKRGVKIPEHIFDKSHSPEFERNMRLIDVCARGKIGMVHKLLQEGADAKFSDYDLRTPLHLACAEGHVSIVRLLISAGADIAAEDRWGATPLEEAMKYEHRDLVDMLEERATASSVTTEA